MHVLYAGDGSAEGPARYLLAVLKRLRARVLHVPSEMYEEHRNQVMTVRDHAHSRKPREGANATT